MAGISLIQAGIVVTVTYIMAMVLVMVVGPLVDEVDQERQDMIADWDEDDGFYEAADNFGAIRQWFYGSIILCCGIATVWFFMVIIAKIRYRRQEDAMHQPYMRY